MPVHHGKSGRIDNRATQRTLSGLHPLQKLPWQLRAPRAPSDTADGKQQEQHNHKPKTNTSTTLAPAEAAKRPTPPNIT